MELYWNYGRNIEENNIVTMTNKPKLKKTFVTILLTIYWVINVLYVREPDMDINIAESEPKFQKVSLLKNKKTNKKR